MDYTAKTLLDLLFITHPYYELDFPIDKITASRDSSKKNVGYYKNLTGVTNNLFPFFKQLLDSKYPESAAIGKFENHDSPLLLS